MIGFLHVTWRQRFGLAIFLKITLGRASKSDGPAWAVLAAFLLMVALSGWLPGVG